MSKNILSYLAITICLFTACSCARVEVIPDDPQAKRCIGDAKRLQTICQSGLLQEYNQCMQNANINYQNELSVANSNRSMVRSQLQMCMNDCQRNYHMARIQEYKPYSTGGGGYNAYKNVQVQNDANHCMNGWTTPNGRWATGPCSAISKEVKEINMPEPPNKKTCAYIYTPCNDEYEANFLNCGGTYK